MSIKQFLELLVPGEWTLDEDGNLMDANDRCPLWHMYERHYWDDDEEDEAEDQVDAGRRCGLRERDAIAIAQAADNRGHPRLRKRLLASVGLCVTPTAASPGGEAIH